MKIIAIYSGHTFEEFNVSSEEDFKHCLNRRLEKSGYTMEFAYVVCNSLPVADWTNEYYEKTRDYERKYKEERDLKEYNRLKAKFEVTK